jgi:tetratricopeptide (TPR) repeat protein
MIRFALLCFATLGVITAHVGAQTASWVGKTIIPKKAPIKFGYTDDQGRQIYHGELELLDYKVLADEDGWIKIQQYDKAGWFDKADAVLVEDAVAYFSRVLQDDPEDEDALARRATAWQLKGELETALKDWSALIQLDPESSAYWQNRGNTHYRLKNYRDAVSDHTEAIRLSPENPNAYRVRAHDHLALREWDKAISDCNEAMRLQPDWLVPVHLRAQAWLGKGEFAKARKGFDEAVRLAPSDVETLNSYAWSLATSPHAEFRDGAKAVALAKKACELREWKDVDVIDTLAAAYAEAGDFDQAVRYQKQCLADAAFVRLYGDVGQRRLSQYEKRQPWREHPEEAPADEKK